jgi:ankyrin repeat protein
MAARRRVVEGKSVGAEVGCEIMELLLARGAGANTKGAWGRTALMFANTATKVDLLVRNGADLEAKDEYGETALMNAAERSDAAVVRALLSHGADVNATDKNGDTALLRSLDDENRQYGEEVKSWMKSRTETAQRILQAKGLNVDAQNIDGETALMRAVRLENSVMVNALLVKGADVNRMDVFGDTAVTLAYEKGDGEIEKLLPRPPLKGQPLKVLNAFLKAAIARKDEAFARELLKEGADPNHKYPIGYTHKDVTTTVLVSAAVVGQPSMVQMLVDKGANVNATGLIYGSESGLKYGTALEAAEHSQNAEVAAILKKASAIAK